MSISDSITSIIIMFVKLKLVQLALIAAKNINNCVLQSMPTNGKLKTYRICI